MQLPEMRQYVSVGATWRTGTNMRRAIRWAMVCQRRQLAAEETGFDQQHPADRKPRQTVQASTGEFGDECHCTADWHHRCR